MTSQPQLDHAALDGLRVVEIAQLIAGPMVGSFLADFGADVVHVEDNKHGDPARYTGLAKDGVYLWWKVSGRNKRSVTLNLRTPEGQDVARRLCKWADVVITNFRYDTLVRWGLDWETLHAENPKLVMCQITGFGATSSQRNRPGFGKVGEAMSGVVHITGFPDGPPVHTGFSHADSITGLFGAFAVQTALYRKSNDPDFDGEYIDIALFEGLYRLIEWQVIFYDQTGVPPMRAGNQLANAPAAVINMYQSSDGQWITVTTGTWKSVKKVAALLGEPPEDYATPELQWERTDRLDQLLREYVESRPADDVLAAMASAEVVASVIYDVEDIMNDQTYQEREDIIQVDDPDLGPVRMQAVLPKLSNHGGKVWRTGPALGQDNELVYKKYIAMTDSEYDDLVAAEVI
ncbi:MAG: CoA transferase [Acidimicrobiaceae bacterium]|nr:CoA transferase [Acidimicrobiaceae bacterium]